MTNWQTQALKKFEQVGSDRASEFAMAEPFPHCVIDNFFESNLIDDLLVEFPKDGDPIWEESNQKEIQVKLRSNWQCEADIKPLTQSVVHFLNSGAVMRCMTQLTGIENLISDPYYTGGGLNCVKQNGLLDVHVDGNWHHAMGVHRRLNVILYLNKIWDPNWGGSLELWDKEMTECVRSINPMGNRMIIFETHDLTFHGHPSPLLCPPEQSRKSLILYYYTAQSRPEDQVVVKEPHRAMWRKRQMKELT